jgi:hypothetical protein
VTGINLKTAITSLTATATGTPGSVTINELDTIGITSVTATNKAVSITAGGTINVSGILTTGTGGSIALTSTGGWIITDLLNTNRITTATLNVQATSTAASGIKINTNVTSLTAKITAGAGNIAINELNGITLTDVTAFNGWIRVMAAGTVTATNVVSSTDASWNNVTLYTSGGDILVAYVAAGRQNGQINIVAAGKIQKATTYDTAVDLRAKVAILCAGGAIDEYPAIMEKDVGTLFTFGYGQQLNINNYTGDLEIFYIGNQRVCVTATGTIRATYIKTAGQDIFLTSTGANILVDYVTTGLVGWGMVKFEAYNSVIMYETTQTGDDPVTVSAQILKIYTTVGDIIMRGGSLSGAEQAEIYGAGGVTFSGMLSMAKALRIRANNGTVDLTGTITTGDHLEILANQAVTINATVTAALTLRVTSNNSSIIMLGSYTCGDYMEIQSKYDLSFNGTAQSTNQAVRMKSTSGNAILHGSITAYSDIEITSGSGYYSDAVLNALHGTVKLFIRG